MFLQVFSKKVCFCCILGCFAEKKLPQISQILTDCACLEFCEFCVLWEYSSPTDCTDQHRWLVALVVAWVRQDAIPSYICVNPCYLWETLLYKKLLCRSVKSVGEYHSEKVLCRSVKSVGENRSKKVAWVRQDAIPSYICVNPCYLWETLLYKKVLCRSVKSVGGNRSKKVRVKSVGELFWLRGVYPHTEQTGRGCSPTDFTDSHRWYVFGIL